MKRISTLAAFVLAFVGVAPVVRAEDSFAYEIQYLESTGAQYIDTGIEDDVQGNVPVYLKMCERC